MLTVDVVARGMSLVSDQGNFALCGVYLIRGEGHTVLYDFGHVGRRHKLLASLERRGVRPSDVDTVVVSHTHWDHIQNLDLFPDATVVVHQAELDYTANPHADDLATPLWTRSLFIGRDLRTPDDGDELANGLTVLHLPGHTPGSIGLRAETADGVAVLTGDALATAEDAGRAWCPNVFWDPEQADASVRRALDAGDLYYPGHDRPFRFTGDGGVDYLVAGRTLTMRAAAVGGPIEVEAADRTRRNLSARAAEAATSMKRGERRGKE
jgi:N-acyl homoserine lactone hydrolase